MSHWTTGLESSIGMISSKLSESTSSVPWSSGNSSNCEDDCGHPTQLAYPAYYQSWKRSALWFCSIHQMANWQWRFLVPTHHGEVSYCLSEQVVYSPDGVNSAVLSKRGTKVIEKKVKFHFGELYNYKIGYVSLRTLLTGHATDIELITKQVILEVPGNLWKNPVFEWLIMDKTGFAFVRG